MASSKVVKRAVFDADLLDVERARAYLAECRDLVTVKKIRDQAEAMARYLRAQKAGDDSAARASVIAREAEARGGELLAAMKLQGKGSGGRPGPLRGKSTEASPLKSLGLKPADSKRMHAAAAVPAKERQRVYDKAVETKKPVAANALPKIAREKSRRKKITKLRQAPVPQPAGRFHVIVIDPPWKYDRHEGNLNHRAANPYPDMDVAAIKALRVAQHAEKDCILWLWTTNAFMREAFECLDAWGFTQKTILTWAKDRMVTGHWLRGQTEHCLFATRGKPIVDLKNQTTLLEAPVREHSRKPDEFFALVESLCPGTRLEMFARQKREGWQVWGAETEEFREKAS